MARIHRRTIQNDLHNPDNHEGVITHTHLEPDILECEVSWALGRITMNKANGSNGIPAELFKILKDLKCSESAALNMPANLENSSVATGQEKVSFHSKPREQQFQRIIKLPYNCPYFTCC